MKTVVPAVRRAARRACAGLFLPAALCLLLSLNGCNIFGAFFAKVAGPTPVEAKYKPSKKKPLVVLVENYRNPSSVRLDAERLSRHITDEISRHHIAPVIDPGEVDDLRAKPAFRTMSQSAVGRAVGAGQVLYVNVVSFDVEEALGSGMIKGRAELTVKLVDTATSRTLWPSDTTVGHPMSIETAYQRTGEHANEMTLREQMCRQFADQIGKLFRKYTPDYDAGDAGSIR